MSAPAAAPPDARVHGGALTPFVTVDRLTKVFGHGQRSVTALSDVNLCIKRGEFVCVLGASGCGKSTLLSLIAGLDTPTSGTVERPAAHPALMFQEAALLPWLSVRRNVELPLRLRHAGSEERRTTVNRLLAMVGLLDFADSRPHELSGGMRQRAALARALAQDSRLLLMDEPFAALDAITRDQLHEDLTRIWVQTRTTVVFVTHNVREAVRLGDRVVLMSSKPGSIGRTWHIDIPRPRELDGTEVASLAHDITAVLRHDLNGTRT